MRLREYILTAKTGLDAIQRAPIVEENTGLKCIRIQDISQKKEYDDWGNTIVSESDYAKSLLKKNDILIARTGATVGVSFFVEQDTNAVFNNGTIRLRFNEDVNPKYIAVDWYGRIVGERWIENRKKHNRRVCYEFARFYAKAINELLDKNEELEAVMVGDKENLHYFVGLTGDKYSILLDLDDFNKIKDLTRLKLGMTIDGITIIRDESRIFENAVKEFNSNRLTELPEVTEAREIKNKDDLIPYFKSIVEILRNHNIDSQGFMEFMKSIIESEEIEVEKVWKKIDGEEKRYVRCLIFEYNNETYLLDSVDKILFSKDKDDLDRDSFVLNPAENEYPYFGG